MPTRNKPVVTVIIATYNRSSTLHYALKSVLWQTFGDFECWIIGDGCTDDSESVVARFGDPRFFWHNLPRNTGDQSAPTNEALRRARGKYIAYLHHDDLWLPNHLQVLVDWIESEQGDVVYSIMEWIRDSNRHHVDIAQYPNALRPPEASATLHSLEIVGELGYWKAPQETRTFPRVDFLRRAQFSGKKFVFAPRLTVLKFDHGKEGYSALGRQAEYMERIIEDPLFVERELASLLADAYQQLEGPISLRRLRFQILQMMRMALVKRGIEPSELMFWMKPGQRINAWRKSLGLDTDG